MPDGRIPGSQCGESKHVSIDSGTLCCAASPTPGPVAPSQNCVPDNIIPGRLYTFVVVEGPMKAGTLVRKVYVSANEPYLKNLELSPLQELAEVQPEKYGLHPRAPNAKASVAEHVLGLNKNTSFVSASNLPDGTPRMRGSASIC